MDPVLNGSDRVNLLSPHYAHDPPGGDLLSSLLFVSLRTSARPVGTPSHDAIGDGVPKDKETRWAGSDTGVNEILTRGFTEREEPKWSEERTRPLL